MDELDAFNYQQKTQNQRTTSDDEYAGSMREEKLRSFLSEIDPSNQAQHIIMKLRGYRYNHHTEMWEKRKEAFVLSDDFIAKVEYVLSEELSLNTTFGNMQPNDVNRLMDLLIEILVNDSITYGSVYYAEYNGKRIYFDQDDTTKEVILSGIFSAVFKCLRRSLNGRESDRFFRSFRMNENIAPPKGEKGGMMEAVKTLFSQ